MIKREGFDILNQQHQMRAEGCQNENPDMNDIKIAVGLAGYEATNIHIFYDNMQGLWQWICDIK